MTERMRGAACLEEAAVVTRESSAFEADYAVTIQPHEAAAFEASPLSLNERWTWTGWKNHHWPADVVRPGLLVYGFDRRRDRRKLFVLLQATRGGGFLYRSMPEFVENVRRLTGLEPNRYADDDSEAKWDEVEQRLGSRTACTGVCMRWRVVKEVAISLPGRFPRLGWCALRDPNFGMHGVEPVGRAVSR
jgi:hypothetical protein